MRLRPDFVIPSNWSLQARTIAKAMQNYGLYIADIGSNLFVQGEPNALWDEAIWQELQSLHASDFEFVDLSAISNNAQFNPDSLQVPAALITPDDATTQAPGNGGGNPTPAPTSPSPTTAGGGGCSIAANTTTDPFLPILLALSLAALRRNKQKTVQLPNLHHR